MTTPSAAPSAGAPLALAHRMAGAIRAEVLTASDGTP